MNHGRLLWYALHVRAQFEKVVAINLSRKGIDAFLPTFETRGRSSEPGHSEMPLFPNYVFCRIQDAELQSVLTTPGVIHIMGTKSGVKPVDEAEIAAVKLVVQAPVHYQPCQFCETGRRVRVAGGVLQDLEGILVKTSNGTGIVVGISLLQLAVVVEIGDGTRVVDVPDNRTPVSALPTGLKPSSSRNSPEHDAERVSGMLRYRLGELDPSITYVPATIVFDSSRQTSMAGARGVLGPFRSLVLQAEDFNIHLEICHERQQRHILGQILSRRQKEVADARCYLLRNGKELQAATVDALGEFNFTDVPEGDLNLQVDFPDRTIIGSLTA